MSFLVQPTAPVNIVCAHCGSEDVLSDAWARWSTETQQWELDSTLDMSYCNACDGECRVREIALGESA